MLENSISIPKEFEEFRTIIEDTIRPVIQIDTTEKETTLFESKFAGNPYFPKQMEYPKSDSGTPLTLLAQINFAEVPAHIPNLPEKGILQFYLDAHDDLIGMDFDNGKNQNGFRVIYHENIVEDESELIQDFSFVSSPDDEMFFPVEKEMKLSFDVDWEALTTSDYRREEKYAPIFEFIEEKEDLEDLFYDSFAGTGHKIDGYPFFTQEDPRTYGDYTDADILLLQVDSIGEHILWGDSGVGNFFISKKDLENKDFSKVLYNWDCY